MQIPQHEIKFCPFASCYFFVLYTQIVDWEKNNKFDLSKFFESLGNQCSSCKFPHVFLLFVEVRVRMCLPQKRISFINLFLSTILIVTFIVAAKL